MRKQIFMLSVILFALTANLVSAENLPKNPRRSINDFCANIMLAERIDFSSRIKTKQFQKKLITAKLSGVDAVTVHVWWGLVEGTEDQAFDWTYYDKLFKIISRVGLKIQPEISFHKFGNGLKPVGNIHIPFWIWKIAGKGGKFINELKEPGSDEFVSFWAENADDVREQYIQFMEEFQNHFARYADIIQSILISCGPDGECRYPSYDIMYIGGQSYGRGYPTRGYLNCYSEEALIDFQETMRLKYKSIKNLNKAWKTELYAYSDICLPESGDEFFIHDNENSLIKTQYGRDFIDWYNSEMCEHVTKMLSGADIAFNNEFNKIPLGVKIPAVHWTMGNPVMSRSAEICAGLLDAEFSINVEDDGCGQGYSTLIQAVRKTGFHVDKESGKEIKKRDIFAVFSGLDMISRNCTPAYSMTENLVFGFGAHANKAGLIINGENINLPSGSSTWNKKSFWWNINNALVWCWYDGVTLRYLDDIQSVDQAENYERLINLRENG